MKVCTEPSACVGELTRSIFGCLLVKISRYTLVRKPSLWLALRLEGGAFYSQSARDIMSKRYGVEIGAYSYGACFIPGQLPPRVIIGRYVSVAAGVCVLQRNHPLDRLSTHPFFFNARLGWVPSDSMPFTTLRIDHDAWIGERAVFTPGCTKVGIGAVVGAGAVVTKDVPPFAIVCGNPARVIRYRFPETVQNTILSEKWWLNGPAECQPKILTMSQPYLITTARH